MQTLVKDQQKTLKERGYLIRFQSHLLESLTRDEMRKKLTESDNYKCCTYDEENCVCLYDYYDEDKIIRSVLKACVIANSKNFYVYYSLAFDIYRDQHRQEDFMWISMKLAKKAEQKNHIEMLLFICEKQNFGADRIRRFLSLSKSSLSHIFYTAILNGWKHPDISDGEDDDYDDYVGWNGEQESYLSSLSMNDAKDLAILHLHAKSGWYNIFDESDDDRFYKYSTNVQLDDIDAQYAYHLASIEYDRFRNFEWLVEMHPRGINPFSLLGMVFGHFIPEDCRVRSL